MSGSHYPPPPKILESKSAPQIVVDEIDESVPTFNLIDGLAQFPIEEQLARLTRANRAKILGRHPDLMSSSRASFEQLLDRNISLTLRSENETARASF